MDQDPYLLAHFHDNRHPNSHERHKTRDLPQPGHGAKRPNRPAGLDVRRHGADPDLYLQHALNPDFGDTECPAGSDPYPAPFGQSGSAPFQRALFYLGDFAKKQSDRREITDPAVSLQSAFESSFRLVFAALTQPRWNRRW